MNVVEPILYQCKLSPWNTAICAPGSQIESITYRALLGAIGNISRELTEQGLKPGATVAVSVKDSILHSAILFALMALGITSVPVQAYMPKALNIIAVVTDITGLAIGTLRTIVADPSWLSSPDKSTEYKDHLVHPTGGDDFCRIVLTSGTTGEPKGIGLTHKMLIDRNATYAYAKGPRFQLSSRLFCDLGIGSSPGFRYTIYMLSRGGTICFVGANPSAIVQSLDLYRIQNMATSPHGLGEFLKFFEQERDFDCKFDHIVCQGAMLSRELSERVQARMCQNLYSTYGSTEVGTVACGHASMTWGITGAVGYVGPGVLLEVVDQDDRPVAAGREGRLRIRSQSMAQRYVNDPEASGRAFRNGYFYPGDLGYVTEQRMLVITGREKIVLNLGGDSINPEIIEGVLRAFPGVEDAASCAVLNELGIASVCALIVATGELNSAALHEHCAQKLPSWGVPARYVRVAKIPRSGQGKIARPAIAALANEA